MNTAQTEPPFTEAELRAARAQINIRRIGEAAAAMTRAIRESVERSVAEAAIQIQAAEKSAAERKRRVDAAERWLLAQEGSES